MDNVVVLETGRSKIKVPAENLFPGSQTIIFSLCLNTAEEVKEFPGISLTRVVIPFMKSPPS